MGKNYKIIVAHPAQQHSYKTAAGVKSAGMLFKYATTVYNGKKSLTSIATRFLKEDNLKRANGRNSKELDDSEIIQFCEFEGLFLLLLQRIDKSKYFYKLLNSFIINRFGKKIAKYAIDNDVDALIMYDTVSYKAFELLEKKAPHIIRIIDMSAPNFSYMDKIFKDDLKNNTNYSRALSEEIQSTFYNKTIKNSMKEVSLADYFLVASKFSHKSLVYSGISDRKILICPYGFYSSQLNQEKTLISNKVVDRKLNCLFVGRVTQKKGAFHLFDAINKLDLSYYSFKFVGTYETPNGYYDDFKDKCEFVGHVTKDRMFNLYKEADLLVFPSLADGFGLSVLEALSFGLPVICSRNAGASDLIIDGFNGFVIPAGDPYSIYEKLEWFISNKNRISDMSRNAIESVVDYTWEIYNKMLSRNLDVIMKSKEYHE